MSESPHTDSLGFPALGPCCEECGPKFIEEMSEVSPALCLDCAEFREIADREAREAESAGEFRYASRYWLAVRPVNMTPLHVLVDALGVG